MNINFYNKRLQKVVSPDLNDKYDMDSRIARDKLLKNLSSLGEDERIELIYYDFIIEFLFPFLRFDSERLKQIKEIEKLDSCDFSSADYSFEPMSPEDLFFVLYNEVSPDAAKKIIAKIDCHVFVKNDLIEKLNNKDSEGFVEVLRENNIDYTIAQNACSYLQVEKVIAGRMFDELDEIPLEQSESEGPDEELERYLDTASDVVDQGLKEMFRKNAVPEEIINEHCTQVDMFYARVAEYGKKGEYQKILLLNILFPFWYIVDITQESYEDGEIPRSTIHFLRTFCNEAKDKFPIVKEAFQICTTGEFLTESFSFREFESNDETVDILEKRIVELPIENPYRSKTPDYGIECTDDGEQIGQDETEQKPELKDVIKDVTGFSKDVDGRTLLCILAALCKAVAQKDKIQNYNGKPSCLYEFKSIPEFIDLLKEWYGEEAAESKKIYVGRLQEIFKVKKHKKYLDEYINNPITIEEDFWKEIYQREKERASAIELTIKMFEKINGKYPAIEQS